jgi:uncharacterized iron-regulated membrane protein
LPQAGINDTMSKKRKPKYFVGKIHLWLGLTSGLVVFIVAITGCIFVFQKEISDLCYRKTFFVQPQHTAPLPVSRLRTIAQDALGPGQPLNNITVYKDPERAWEFMAYKMNDTALTYFGAVVYYRSVFIDPYTGAVTGFRNYRTDFFSVVKYLHWSLLLNTPYGQPVVGWATFIFVVMLVTGLILWWPKKWNKANRKSRLQIKTGARIKRLIYDLHNVLGFYIFLPVVLVALTGMVWAFPWFKAVVYVAASGSTKATASANVTSKPTAVTGNAMDIAFGTVMVQYPDAQRIGITPATGKEGTIYMFAYSGKETYYNYDALQFDQYSGRLLHKERSRDKNRGERLIGMNYDIHVGAIGGIAGKIIAFLASLVAASLPVTGFCIWWGRGRK